MKKGERIAAIVVLVIVFLLGVAIGTLACAAMPKKEVQTIIEKEVETIEKPVYIEVVKEVYIEKAQEAKEAVQEGREFKLTAYCSCVKCCGEYALNRPVDAYGNEIVYGSTGERLTAGVSVAVDPKVIPYGSTVVINGREYLAQDCGGAIKGDRIDIYFDNHQDALEFGVQYAEVFVK